MNRIYIKIDGMLSATGIRDYVNGEYLDPRDIGLPQDLVEKIGRWVKAYESAHYDEFRDAKKVDALDMEGLDIARAVQEQLPDAKVGYFSAARTQDMKI